MKQSIGTDCPHCDKHTISHPESTVNHVLHFLIATFTCGAWVIIWCLLCLNETKYICNECGHYTKEVKSELAPLAMCGIIVFYLVIFLLFKGCFL